VNLLHLNAPHEESLKVFSAHPGDDIEFELHCRLCGMVSETTVTVPDPRMGSLKLVYRCPLCSHPGMLVLGPVEEN
jgi:hypothetical protein